MKRKVRVGVIGVGALGSRHAAVYARLPDAELVGIHDLDPVRAAKVAAETGAPAFAELLELAGKIEAASVAVPPDRHFEVFRELAGRGCHALVEKPIAARTEQAEEMVRLAERHNVILQVGHVERFNPVMTFLEQRLAEPAFIEAVRLATYPPPRPGAPPRGTEVSVVLDLMIHDLDVVLNLVRRPVAAIRAVGVPVLSSSDDIANARLSFAGGCVANLTASRISRERLRKIRVFQKDTYLSLDYLNQTGRLHRRTAAGIEVQDVPIEKKEPLAAELEAFLHCVERRDAPVVSGRQAFEALKLAVEISRVIRESPS